MRPWLSVSGTRWTRCVPDSYFSRANTSLPATDITASLQPPSGVSECESISTFQRRTSA